MTDYIDDIETETSPEGTEVRPTLTLLIRQKWALH